MERNKAWLKEGRKRLRCLERVVSKEKFGNAPSNSAPINTTDQTELEMLKQIEKVYDNSVIDLQNKMASCYVLQKQKKKNVLAKIKQQREIEKMRQQKDDLLRKNNLLQETVASIEESIQTTRRLNMELQISHDMYMVREELIHQDKLVRFEELKFKVSKYVANTENSERYMRVTSMRKYFLGLKIELMMAKAEKEDLLYMENKFKEIADLRRNNNIVKIASTMSKINSIKNNRQKLLAEKKNLVEKIARLKNLKEKGTEIVNSKSSVNDLSDSAKEGVTQSAKVHESSPQKAENFQTNFGAISGSSPKRDARPSQPTISVFNIFKLPALNRFSSSQMGIRDNTDNLTPLTIPPIEKISNVNSDKTCVENTNNSQKVVEDKHQSKELTQDASQISANENSKPDKPKESSMEITESRYFMKKPPEPKIRKTQENLDVSNQNKTARPMQRNTNQQEYVSKPNDKSKNEKMHFVKPILSKNIPKTNQEDAINNSPDKLKENVFPSSPRNSLPKDHKEFTKNQNAVRPNIQPFIKNRPGLQNIKPDFENIKEVNKTTGQQAFFKRPVPLPNTQFNIVDIGVQKRKPTQELIKNHLTISQKRNIPVKYPGKDINDSGIKKQQNQPMMQNKIANENPLKRDMVMEKNDNPKKVHFHDEYKDLFNNEDEDGVSEISYGSGMSDEISNSPFNLSQNEENGPTSSYTFNFNPVSKSPKDKNDFRDALDLF